MKKIAGLLALFLGYNCYSQDVAFARKIVDTLTSPVFWGRGYTNDGMKKAADFLEAEFKSYGLEPLDGKSFFQHFSYPVNTFPGEVKATVNGKELVPGKDFIVAPETKGIKAEGNLTPKDSATFINTEERFIVHLDDKLTMDLAPEVAAYSMINVDKKSITGMPVSFKVNIENKFLKNFKTENVCGIVKGTVKPDSIIFITAHYDHLGGMGKKLVLLDQNILQNIHWFH